MAKPYLMIEFFENIDYKTLLFFNGKHTDWLDSLMVFFSSNWIWLPIVITFIVLIILKYKKKFWIPFFLVIICFAITDQGSHLTKESIKRYRPTHNLELSEKVHIVNDYRGGKFGFFSGHAANSFGLAILSLLFIKKKYYTYLLLAWAVLVSYSRIYLGVHFPSDIFVGAIFGSLIAWLLWRISLCFPTVSRMLDR